MSGSGISWAVCKSASRSRQTTTPAPHHWVFYRMDALPATQPTASRHWRQQVRKIHIHNADLIIVRKVKKWNTNDTQLAYESADMKFTEAVKPKHHSREDDIRGTSNVRTEFVRNMEQDSRQYYHFAI